METKNWYTSKTLWANIVAIAVMIGATFTEMDIPPELSVSLLAIINVVLRVKTKKAVSLKVKKEK